jgi:hypothetical protein
MKPQIIHCFKIYLTEQKFPVMFSQLSDGKYTKTFMKNQRLEIEFISINEYAMAMAYDGLTTYE